MTRPSKKEGERFLVEKAAEFLGKTWTLGPDREHPDFVVTEGAQQFGLEVCEIFTGQQSGAGSHMKREESETQRAANAIRREYESKKNIPLSVRFVGDMCSENVVAVLRALVAKDFTTKQFGHQEIIDSDKGRGRLRVYATRALRANWFCVNDRAGRVDRHPKKSIIAAIEKKSKKLPQYKECSRLDDIRLLVVANRIMNSGKLLLEERTTLDLRGFRVAYFFSYPESIVVFSCAGNWA